MTKLKIFESPEFGTVRTVTINGAAGDGTGHGASPIPQRAAHRCPGGGFCPD